MAEYRLYPLDAADHIVAGYSVHCISDRAALAAARRLAARATAVEVWQHTRCLGSVTEAQAAPALAGQGVKLSNSRSRPITRPRLTAA